MSSTRSDGVSRAEHNPSEAKRGRVLVVDDEPAMRDVLVRSIGRNHEVVVVSSGGAALDLIAAGELFDAVLFDLCMPNMDGVEFYAAATERQPRLVGRMVLVTGGASTPEQAEFLGRPPCPVVQKPFARTALLGQLQATIEQAGAPS